MMVFDLTCPCGCLFEGWFQDSTDYRRQTAAGLLLCPRCGGDEVHKVLSPVAAVRRGVPTTEGREPSANPLSEGKKMVALLKGLQAYIAKTFEDVGADLAKTALKIHYGVEEERNIRGVATAKEEEMLSKEGIRLLKVPLVAEKDDTE